MYEPAIKWSGSKRSQAGKIIGYFPKEINTYYEPFCGGCSVLRRLIDSDVAVNRFVCSDLNGDLINLWNAIASNPNEVYLYYSKLWHELNADGDVDRKKEYFNGVRERFNRYKDPLDFMFIMRTTTNGMPRYNKDGRFNNSFHVTRSGIEPEKLGKILLEWSEILNNNHVEFINCGFQDIRPEHKDDFMYLDPPYANTKGMFYGKISTKKLWDYLRTIPCRYALSFDGISGKVDNTQKIPSDIFTTHQYLRSGNSSFKRVIGKSRDSIVYESLYLRY